MYFVQVHAYYVFNSNAVARSNHCAALFALYNQAGQGLTIVLLTCGEAVRGREAFTHDKCVKFVQSVSSGGITDHVCGKAGIYD